MDPLCPTAGLGLGLPGLELGLADRLQLEQAKDESDKLHVRKVAEESYLTDLQRVIEESKLSACTSTFGDGADYNSKMDMYAQEKLLALSDWEETNSELEQAAIQNSMESYWSVEQDRKQPWSHSRHHHHHHHRRKMQNGIKGHLRTGSPSYHNDTQDRLYHHIGPSSTYIEPPRLSKIHHDEPLQRGDTFTTDSPVLSSSYASSSVAAVSGEDINETLPSFIDPSVEYPQTVQELVMNGFELSKVLRAYELTGDNFDDMLSVLLSQV